MPTNEVVRTAYGVVFGIRAKLTFTSIAVYDSFRWPELVKVGEFRQNVLIEGWGDNRRERRANDKRLTALLKKHGGVPTDALKDFKEEDENGDPT